jgi:plasmid stabilization system protein ParE
MTFEVEFTPEADADLDRLFDFLLERAKTVEERLCAHTTPSHKPQRAQPSTPPHRHLPIVDAVGNRNALLSRRNAPIAEAHRRTLGGEIWTGFTGLAPRPVNQIEIPREQAGAALDRAPLGW